MKKLDGREQVFLEGITSGKDVTQAARDAKYTERTALTVAHCWLKPDNPRFKKHLYERYEAIRKKAEASTEFNAKWLLNHIGSLLTCDPKDILNEDLTLKPIHDWPKAWRMRLSSFEVKELFAGGGDTPVMKIGELKKIKWIDGTPLMQMLGKHTDVQAFLDKVQMDTEVHLHFDDQDGDA